MNKKYIYGFVALLAVSLVSAGLISYYGQVTQEVTIDQAVVMTGSSLIQGSFVAGDSLTSCGLSVKNNANVPATIQLGTTCNNSAGYDDGIITDTEIDWINVGNDRCDGIETEIYGILELENKDSSYVVIPDNTRATLHYTIVGTEFGYEFEATGLTPITGYSLIYYADKPDRFVNWGGNNPGALIAEVTTDSNGDIILISGSEDLGMSLPHENDANVNTDETDYCIVDGFEHCCGAKIWLVPSSDYSEPGLIAWNPSNYLFETDLIVYSNDGNNEITLPANGGGFDFCMKNDFAVNLIADTYTINTEILPVTA